MNDPIERQIVRLGTGTLVDFERFEIRLDHVYDDLYSGRTRIKLEEPLAFVYYVSRSSELLEDRKELLSEIIDRFKEKVLSRERNDNAEIR